MIDDAALPYLEAMRARLDAARDADWLSAEKRRALARFAAQGLPGAKAEAWKYANLKPLRKQGLVAVQPGKVTAADVAPYLLDIDGAIAVFVDGVFQPGLSRGVEGALTPLAQALEGGAEKLKAFYKADPDANLAQINLVLSGDGLVLDLADGEDAGWVQVLHVATAQGHQASHLRHVLTLGANARAKLVERYVALGDEAYWDNVALNARLGEGASLVRLKWQEESLAAVHSALANVTLAAGAQYRDFSLMIGGASARNEIRIAVAGGAAQAHLAGAQLGRDRQSQDTLTVIDHRMPNSASAQNYKAVLDGAASAAFQGKVIVRPEAQKTDATQSSKSLLLSRAATANAKPELEIYADDVKCAHGATVGELDKKALFYLLARGIDPVTARAMLIDAFVADVFEAIEDETVRAAFAEAARVCMHAQMEGRAS